MHPTSQIFPIQYFKQGNIDPNPSSELLQIHEFHGYSTWAEFFSRLLVLSSACCSKTNSSGDIW